MSEDIISSCVVRLAACKTPDDVRKAEIELRQQWGGAEVYIKKVQSLQKAQRICAVIAAGLTMSEAFDAAGVSRATGYRLVSRLRR